MKNNLFAVFYLTEAAVVLRKFVTYFILCLLFIFFFLPPATAQIQELPNTEQQLENSTAINGDTETEDDAYLQQMQHFIKSRLNINSATEDDLKELKIFTPLQIQNFFSYRSLMGKFISIYELQAIPGWDMELLQKIRLFITVSTEEKIKAALHNRLNNGGHTVLIRVSQALQQSKGYTHDTTANFYPGSPQKLLVRYTYRYKNLLQYGLLGEKDAGEQFFKGKQRQGFDFYSAHFFAKHLGIVESLALGDFTVNFGQGLIQWQRLAFKKGPGITNNKREAAILAPYHSAGEINFHRGAGITIKKNRVQATLFMSFRNIDANRVADTLSQTGDYISSLQTSGYHRTKSETDDKGTQQQLAFGANLSYRYKQLHVGVNGIQYKFKLPLQKPGDPYNIYALSGSSLQNFSVDYSYTYKNLHFFGEAAVANSNYPAFLNGLLISTAAAVDISLLYRNISPAYQSLYANAFTENTYPANEKGLFMGTAIHPGGIWRVEAYADFFTFPWLKYRVDAPAGGADYFLQFTCSPNKQLELYTRIHSQSKPVNFNPAAFPLSPVITQVTKNWRTQLNFKCNNQLTIRARTEVVWFKPGNNGQEQGYLGYTDFLYKPLLKPWAGSFRMQYFETGSYNTRLYAYENDVLYSFAIPVFYDKGIRYYINIKYDVSRKMTIWLRWAQTIYKGKTTMGSGLDEINGNKKTEVRFQALYNF